MEPDTLDDTVEPTFPSTSVGTRSLVVDAPIDCATLFAEKMNTKRSPITMIAPTIGSTDGFGADGPAS